MKTQISSITVRLWREGFQRLVGLLRVLTLILCFIILFSGHEVDYALTVPLHNSVEIQKQEEKVKEIPLKQNSSSKTYMSVYSITDSTSTQYDYIWNSGHCKFDSKGFIICDNEYIGVAMGTFFGPVGTKYILTLSSGATLRVCKVEHKSDLHTDEDNYLAQHGHLIEFVINPNTEWMQTRPSTNGYIFNGNFNNYFEGSVVRIQEVL